MVESFERIELQRIGGIDSSNTGSREAWTWTPYKDSVWREFHSLDNPDGLPSDEVILRVNATLRELTTVRGKNPHHQLFQYGIRLLRANLPDNILRRRKLTGPHKEAVGYIKEGEKALEEPKPKTS